MPIIAYACVDCKHIDKKFRRTVTDVPSFLICSKCGKNSKKLLSAPTQQSKITIDNGIQARAVEVNPDIVEINKARSEKNYRED